MEKMIFLFDDAIFSIFNGKCYAYNLNFYIEKTKLNERIYFWQTRKNVFRWIGIELKEKKKTGRKIYFFA